MLAAIGIYMQNRFKLTFLLCSAFFTLFSAITTAEESQACASYQCLSDGLLDKADPTACAEPIKNYSSIRVISNCDFNPEETAKKREEYIKECTTADEKIIEKITYHYGEQWDVDVFIRKQKK